MLRNIFQFSKRIVISLILVFLTFYSEAQVDREFVIYHKNGKVFRESKSTSGICGAIFRESTYDTEGNLIRREDWKNRKRCGNTVVYVDNKKIKEIEFKDGYMESYIAYKFGSIYNQISKDRNTLIRKGKVINVNWKKYYQPVGPNAIIALDKYQLINILRNQLIPEEILISMEEISKDFDRKKIPGDNGYLSCTSSSASVNDGNINPTSTNPSEKKKVDDKGREMQNTCASAIAKDLTGGLSGAAGNAAKQGRIDRARQGIDKMIENCGKMGGTTSGGLVSNLPGSGGGGGLGNLPTTPPMLPPGSRIINGDQETTQIRPMFPPHDTTEDDIHDKPTHIFEKILGAAAVVATVGVIITGVAIFIGAAPATAVAGVIIVVGGIDTGTGTGTGTPGGKGPDAAMPISPDMGNSDNCERLKNFKKWCELSNWQDPKCANAVNLFGGCGGDITKMYVTSGGDVTNMECASPLSDEEIAKRKCKEKGMIARPAPGGNVCRTTGSFDGLILPSPNANVTDPPRGDFRQIFSGTSFQFADNSASLSNALKDKNKTYMVVFMDPDCPSCKNNSNSLATMDAQNAIKNNNIQVVIVDGGVSNDVLIDNNILAYPTTIVLKNGIKTNTTVGSMTTAETVKFVNDFR